MISSSSATLNPGQDLHKSSPGDVQAMIAVLSCLTIYVFLARFYLAFPSTVEDSFIIFRYASHAAASHGLSWNVGLPRDQGLTGVAWALLLAMISPRTGGVEPRIAGYAGLAIGCVTLTLFYLAIRSMLPRRQRPLAGTGMFALALCPYFLRHSASGMETGLTCLLFITVIYIASTFPFHQLLASVLTTVGLAVISFLVRPDAPLFTLFTVVPLVYWRSSEKKMLRSSLVLFTGLISVGAVSVVVGDYFTTPFPLPAYLKLSITTVVHHPMMLRWLLPLVLSFQMKFLSAVSVWVVLCLVAGLSTREPYDVRLKAILSGSIAFFCYLFTVIPIMNFQMRYQMPLLIPAIFLGTISLAHIIEAFGKTWNTHPLLRTILYSSMVFSTSGTLPEIKAETRDSSRDHQIFKGLGQKLARLAPLRLASSEAGILAYYSDVQFLDLIGLNNTFVSLNHKKPDYDLRLEEYLGKQFGYPDLYVRKIGYVDTYADLCAFPGIISKYSFVGEVNGPGSPGLFLLKTSPKNKELMQVITELQMLPVVRPGATEPMTTAEGCAAATESMNSDSVLQGN